MLEIVLYFTGIFLFIASAIAAVMKKKITSPKVISSLTKIHLFFLILTVLLIVLWSFKIHLRGQTLEIMPFWLFIFTGIFLFGLTKTESLKKVYFAFIFYGHLFFSLIIFIPYLGSGITFLVYSYFIPDHALYENDQLRVQYEERVLMSMREAPFIYIKCGPFELKRKTHIYSIYSLDSVKMTKLDDKNLKLKFFDSESDGISHYQTDTIACGCP